MNRTVPGEESENRIITDFFSDHDISDATFRFEESYENVSLVFTLSSGKEVLKSETSHLGSANNEQKSPERTDNLRDSPRDFCSYSYGSHV
ncbi:MAG: hypothetical protein RBR63_07815 [Methanosarcina vacuolata]|jgi:hypothetical protein|nr:hypothetical protein [Methanosarcina vacuolata]